LLRENAQSQSITGVASRFLKAGSLIRDKPVKDDRSSRALVWFRQAGQG